MSTEEKGMSERNVIDTTVNTRLDELASAYSKAHEKVGTTPRPRFPPIPDDTYHVQIMDVYMDRTLKGDPKIVWVLKILTGDFAGRRVWYNRVLPQAGESKEDQERALRNLEYLIKDLQTCGVDVQDLRTLAAHLPFLRGVELMIRLVSKEDELTGRTNRNIYLNERVETNDDVVVTADPRILDEEDMADFPIG